MFKFLVTLAGDLHRENWTFRAIQRSYKVWNFISGLIWGRRNRYFKSKATGGLRYSHGNTPISLYKTEG